MNRFIFRDLARHRVEEARVLYAAACHSGAYYLAGYAVECGLKACIARATRKFEFPELKRVTDSYTHSLPKLVAVAKLTQELKDEQNRDPQFVLYWNVAIAWSEAARYEVHDASKASELLDAVANRQHGVMRWLRKHW